jgi:hypothetical protein
MAQLAKSHPSSIVSAGVIHSTTCYACASNTAPDSSSNDPTLHAELEELHPHLLLKYQPYTDVFSKQKGTTLPPCGWHLYDHKIDIEPDTMLLFGPIYSLSEVEQLALREFLDENLTNHFIRPLSSSAGTPILFIHKKDSSLHLAIDYRGLNQITKKDRYPLPLIPNLLNCLHSANIYTKINLCSAYNLVRITKGNEWKTAFHTRYSSYEFQVMHYGLTNAPMSFQRFMSDVFKDLLDICVVVYLDDILIYSESQSEYENHVCEVLCHLHQFNLFAKMEKCEFNVITTNFLGYIISTDGIHMDDAKIQVIQDWLVPKKVKDIQSFLGFSNFYQCFIFTYSNLMIPLMCLTQKNAQWFWSPSCQEAFTLLKKAFMLVPIL